MPPDIVLAGGGLANALLAWRLKQVRPDLRLLLIEGEERLGGNHTWSCHESDLTPTERAWLSPLVVHEWPHYEVAFEGLSRRVALAYLSLTSQRLHEVVADALGVQVRLGVRIESLAPREVRLAGGERIAAGAVIDGRGFAPSPHLALRHQKFLGLEMRLKEGHGLSGPVLMDARVPQVGGYRFVYVLPLGPDRVLVEDTYYADDPSLDRSALRGRIAEYARSRGWNVAEVLREEEGVLPIALGGDLAAHWDAAGPGMPRVGMRAGLFHATTGYSLPAAVRVAGLVAGLDDLSPDSLARAIRGHAVAHWRGQRFFRLLNRMLFLAGSPADRHRVLERFYGLPDALVARFYAGRLSAADKFRLLAGRPPVPILGAIQAAGTRLTG